MIATQARLIPLTDINFPESRQREEINLIKVLELATSIACQGLLQDIGFDANSTTLVWGGHRFTAFQLCNAVATNKETPLTAEYKEDELETLRQALSSSPKTYEKWAKIPAKLVKGASPNMLAVLELSENLNRLDLSWQEKAAAVSIIHRQAVRDAQAERKRWSDSDTANLIGCSRELINQLLGPERKLAAITDPKVRKQAEEAIKKSPTALSASNAAETVAKRHGHSTKQSLRNLLRAKSQQPETAKSTEAKAKNTDVATSTPIVSLGERSIICADFHKWAATYFGPKFNFVHCDFPYGIDFNKSQGQDGSAATAQIGNYDDSEPVYWSLLETLLNSRSRLLEPSAHIMFWLSVGESKKYKMSMLDVTKKGIKALWPDAHISSIPLVWHYSDAAGLAPSPLREPRRTYEWALHITLGDRPLVRVNNASISSPKKVPVKLHRSQKHLEVLRHFFSMFVDSSTRMLDPTCGSGTSIITAHRLGAKSVFGLEIGQEMRDSAVKHFDEATR
jgi:ParB-like chromosome segregation protein Spo0J